MTTPTDPRALARLIVSQGTPEMLYEMGEAEPVGSEMRAAYFHIAAILARRREAMRKSKAQPAPSD